MLPDVLYFDGVKYQKDSVPVIPQLWMQKEDRDTDIWNYGNRPCASTGCPAVFTLKEPNLKMQMDMNWQFYLRAINYNMTLENVFLLLDNQLAFANNTGFDNLDNPGKKDYFFGRTNYSELPRLDKDRTCSRNIVSGTIVGSYLKVTTLNGNNPPPLKPGKSYPQRIQDVNIDDYLYNPKDHPWLFVVANRVTVKPGNQTSVAPFPRGAIYPWTGDNNNYSFMPLVSREEILYPLKHLSRVSVKPSPYRIVTTFMAIKNILGF